jgi:hypothetical protein
MKGGEDYSEASCHEWRGILKGEEGDCIPLPPHRIHPRHKWPGILRDFQRTGYINTGEFQNIISIFT